jgi:hypothetical protein
MSLALSNIYDLRTSFASSYPNVSQPGIYVMMDSHGTVLRIGTASCGRTLGDRLGDYFKWGDRALGSGVARNSQYGDVCFVVTIGLPSDRAFEAPAIEEYLLSKVDAPLNSHGRR